MKNLKKAITLVLALIIALSTCMVGVSASATEDEVTTTPQDTSIYFEIPEDWTWDRIYCYIYIYGGDALASWQVKKTKCEILDNNIAVYDTTKVGGLVEGTEYCVIMSSDVGLQTHDTLFTTECLGDTLYCDDTRYENPHDSSKRVTAAFWKNQDADKYGPVMKITSIGNVIGTALPSSKTKQTFFTEFLNNSLDNSRVYSGKTDQQIIDDIIVAIGITADEAETIINDTGIQVDWTNNSTPSEKPTGDYFISDTEGADRESAKTYAYGYVGDVDLTDSVNIKDATAIQKHAASLLDLRDTNAILADIDFSDNINVKDATSIQKWIAGMEVTMPVYHLLTATDENIEHVHAYTFTSQPVSCDFAAHVRYDCDCGYYYTSNYIGEALGHDWGEWVVTKEPALGVDGEEKSTCSNCKQTWTRTIDMIIEGDQDAISAAREMVSDFLFSGVRHFETVDELYAGPHHYGAGVFTFVFFRPLIREEKFEIDEETGFYVFKRADLDAIALKYFDRTFDWTTRTNKDSEFYDKYTDTVHFKKLGGFGGPLKYKVVSCTDNNDGTYTIGVEENYIGDITKMELILKKTEYGYPAVSFREKEIVPTEQEIQSLASKFAKYYTSSRFAPSNEALDMKNLEVPAALEMLYWFDRKDWGYNWDATTQGSFTVDVGFVEASSSKWFGMVYDFNNVTYPFEIMLNGPTVNKNGNTLEFGSLSGAGSSAKIRFDSYQKTDNATYDIIFFTPVYLNAQPIEGTLNEDYFFDGFDGKYYVKGETFTLKAEYDKGNWQLISYQ